MIGKTISHYKILEKLGGGGMGVVYKAKDNKLDRTVALKFLPPHLHLDDEAEKRFISEAKAASSFDHPNICTIYEIDKTDDNQLFIAMACYEGETLKKKLENGPIKIDEAIKIASQVAEGLSKAHKKGIVHRDIKPANIFITNDGTVKILDFGLAKVSTQTKITTMGTTSGTIAYMSPEQSKGEDVDQRTDIWSLGVVMYEMLTGELPFKGDYEQAVIYSIITEEPKPITELHTDIPLQLTHLVEKTLQKDPVKRYQTIKDLIEDINETNKTESTVKEKNFTHTVAVLPFADMSPARDQDYFCEGVAEEILNSINKIKEIQIVSRTSSFQFKTSDTDVREIGKHLNATAVLEGSVRKAGNLLRINVQLTNVSDGFYLWSERYDRELDDVFKVQENIAENVITALRGVLSPKEKQALHQSETTIAAYEYFLKGRQFINQIAVSEAKEMFEKAVEQDPGYAMAYAGLADVHSWRYEWWGAKLEDLRAANRYSSKALELAPQLAESHISRGYVLSLENHYNDAEKEFQAAINLNPNAFDAYYYYARACFARGEIEKSAGLFARAAEVRREDFQSLILLAQSLNKLNKNDDAKKSLREGIRRAERQLDLEPSNRRALSIGALALFEDGKVERALKLLERGLKLYPDDQGVLLNAACLMSRAGRKKEALDFLEKVFGKGYGKRDWIENDPDYDSLRDEPRFQALLNKLK